jgi:hypothetical protein
MFAHWWSTDRQSTIAISTKQAQPTEVTSHE